MKECDGIDSLTRAEKACRDLVEEITGVKTYRFAQPGETECAVFDIGRLMTGNLTTFEAKRYHFRATLDLYNRDHDDLQRMIMLVLLNLPVNEDFNASSDLRDTSNVLSFRIVPETDGVCVIQAQDVQPARGGAAIPCYVCTLTFDVVFAARFD